MASKLRKAIGAMKDQTSISIAKVAGNVAPDLEILIVKATTHDNDLADDKYATEILHLMSNSEAYVNACVVSIYKRLHKTHDWVVALKALMLVHRLLNYGDPDFGQEIMYTSRKGLRVLNMSDFRDEAHSKSWDHSGFVRTYSLYLEQKVEFLVYVRKLSIGDDEKKKRPNDGYGESAGESSYGMDNKKYTPPTEDMGPEMILERLNHLLRLLDRFLACKPTGAAKNTKMVLVALYLLVKESFGVYSDTSTALNILLDHFLEQDYAYSVKAFDAYVNASKTIDKLIQFYGWCMDIGVLRSSELPEVNKISDKHLGDLEGLLRGKGNKPKSPKKSKDDVSSSIKQENDIIKSLPAPESYKPPTPVQPLYKPPNKQITKDLVNLSDDPVSADEHNNKLALALFSTPAAANTNSTWQTFSEDEKPNWELALVEKPSNLSNQKSELAGGFDSLLLNGMYDSATIKQHVNNSALSSGSSSSVAMPGMSKNVIPILALPAPDGSVERIGQEDPFAASLLVPPPSYVQIADMERKQQLLIQEQQLWQQYANNGMQGQMGFAKIAAGNNVMGQASGYHYNSY